MRIDAIALRNFRCHKDLNIEMNPGPMTIIAGYHGSGKSSIRDGIQYALTGTCRGLKGRKAEILQKWGTQRKGGAALFLNGLEQEPPEVTVKRSLGDGPRSKAQKATEQQLGFSGAVMDVCLDGSKYFGLPDAERASLLVSLLGIDAFDIGSVLRASGYDSDEAPPIPRSLDELSLAYEKVYEKRTALGRAVRSQAAMEPPERPEAICEIVGADLDAAAVEAVTAEITKTLEEFRDQLRYYEQADSRAELDALEKRPAVDLPTVADIQEAVKRADIWFRKGQKSRTDGLDLRQRVGRAQAALDAATSTHHSLVQAKDQRKSTNMPTCETCGQKIKVVDLTKRIKAAADVVKQAELALNLLQKEAGNLVDPDNAQAEGREMTKKANDMQEVIDHEQAAVTRISIIKAELAKEGDVPQPEDTKDGLTERIERGVVLHTEAKRYMFLLLAHEDSAGRESDAEADWKLADKYVDILSPKNSSAKLVNAKMGDFVKMLNGACKSLPWEFDINEDVRLIFKAKQDLDVTMACETEEMRASIAFSAVVAAMTGFGLVVVDGADKLHGDALEDVKRIATLDGIDQLVLIGTGMIDADITLNVMPL